MRHSSGFYLSVLDHGSRLAVKLSSIAVSAVIVAILAAPILALGAAIVA